MNQLKKISDIDFTHVRITNEYFYNGAQVVVNLPDQGMGTVIEVECSDCKRAWPQYEPGTKVLIEGDREAICFPRDKVVLYSEVYNGWESNNG